MNKVSIDTLGLENPRVAPGNQVRADDDDKGTEVDQKTAASASRSGAERDIAARVLVEAVTAVG